MKSKKYSAAFNAVSFSDAFALANNWGQSNLNDVFGIDIEEKEILDHSGTRQNSMFVGKAIFTQSSLINQSLLK